MDRHVESRLKKELVIWLVTAGKDARPQAVPVWFLWDGNSFEIHSQDGSKIRQLRSNPYVELHLNSDDAGDEVVRASGRATLSQRRPTAAYVRKYGREIKRIGLAPEDFVDEYHNAIRVRRPRFH